MTYTLSTPLAEAIDAAKKAGACEGDIKRLRALDKPGATIGDLANHPEGAFWAYWFARVVIKGRFEVGEAAIAKGAIWAYLYAKHVIKGRFKAGEVVIAKDAGLASSYSKLPGVPSDWRTQI